MKGIGGRLFPRLPGRALVRQIFLSMVFFGVLCGTVRVHAASPPLRVAAAADLMPVLPSLLKRFTRQTGIPVLVSWGSSGEEAVAIRHGAPYDLFLSADSVYPETLAGKGFLKKDSLRVYARGVLVLWFSGRTPAGKPLPGIEGLAGSGIAKIAMANPRLAPYGLEARKCLESRGLWEVLKPKVVYGNSLAQVAWYLRAGAAQAGFLSEAHAKALSLRVPGGYSVLSPSCAPFLEQQMGILRRTGKPRRARALEMFLLGAKAQAYLRSHGYR